MRKTIITTALSLIVSLGYSQVKQDSVTVTIPAPQKEMIIKAIVAIHSVLSKSNAPYNETAPALKDLEFLAQLFNSAQPKKVQPKTKP